MTSATATERTRWLYEVDWANSEEKASVPARARPFVEPDFRVELLTGRRWGPVRGLEGLQVFGEAVEEDFVELEYEAQDVKRTEGDQVIVTGEVHGRGRTSGLEMSAEFSHEWTFRNGLATEIKALAA